MKDFGKTRVFARKIVVHETCFFGENEILENLRKNDVLFFDDCLYSQFVFARKNEKFLIENGITCVFGFSTSIFRESGAEPVYFAECAKTHDMVHEGDEKAYSAYMSTDELLEFREKRGFFIACHGDKHVKLETAGVSRFEKSQIFAKDLAEASRKLKELRIETDIFVYPYAYDDFPLSEKIVKNAGYRYVFAGKNGKRTPIEQLIPKK